MALATPSFTSPNFRKQFMGATQPGEEEFDITKSPLFQQSQKTAESQLAGETPAFEIQSNIAREAQKAASAQLAARKREQLMGAGLRDTGKYIDEGILQPAAEEERTRMDLERQLTVERQNQMNARQAQGQQSAGQLLGMIQTGQEGAATRGVQKELAYADISSREGIAVMQNDTERWKQGRIEELTKQGWTHDEAMQKAEFEQQTTQNGLDRELQAEIEAGRLSMAEKELAQNASQFTTKLDFDKYALQAGFDEAATSRAWEANENALGRVSTENLAREKMAQEERLLGMQQTFQANQTALEQSLTREIEAGRISQADRQMVQQAAQFNTELDFRRWAKDQDLSSEEANRIWTTSERVSAEAHDQTMTELRQSFATKGIVLDAVMANIQNQYGDDPEKAAAMMRQIAEDNGIDMSRYTAEADAAVPPVPEGQTDWRKPSITVGPENTTTNRLGADSPSYESPTGWQPFSDGQTVKFEQNMTSDINGETVPIGTYQVKKMGENWWYQDIDPNSANYGHNYAANKEKTWLNN